MDNKNPITAPNMLSLLNIFNNPKNIDKKTLIKAHIVEK